MPPLWSQLEEPRWYLDESDICYYARVRVPGGFDKSEANQLISNLQKPSSTKGSFQWKHKETATKRFAAELHQLFGGTKHDLSIPICFLPTSKLATDAAYDPRWDMVSKELLRLYPAYPIEHPISVRASEASYKSQKNSSRQPSKIMANYVWNGFKGSPQRVILVDDVLTTGGHFKAAKDFIQQNAGSHIQVYGVFWAKHQHAEE